MFCKYTEQYRYGFNGKENDNEVKGTGNSLDFGARMYDPRLGKFLSIDPLAAKYPYVSNYSFALDNPIFFIDHKGEDVHPSLAMRLFHPKQYKAVITLLKTEEGKKLFQDYASAREAKKYWGSGQAGKNSKNTDVIFNSGNKEGAVTYPSIEIDGKAIHPLQISGDNVSKIHGESKVQIKVFVAQQNEGKGTIGGEIVNGAHEAFVHAKNLLTALNTLRNENLSVDEKQKYLEQGKEIWGILDADYHHALIHLGKATSYENVLKEIKSKYPEYVKDIDAAMSGDKDNEKGAGKVLQEKIDKGNIDKSKLDEPK